MAIIKATVAEAERSRTRLERDRKQRLMHAKAYFDEVNNRFRNALDSSLEAQKEANTSAQADFDSAAAVVKKELIHRRSEVDSQYNPGTTAHEVQLRVLAKWYAGKMNPIKGACWDAKNLANDISVDVVMTAREEYKKDRPAALKKYREALDADPDTLRTDEEITKRREKILDVLRNWKWGLNKKGLPRLDALRLYSGVPDVTRKERNELWKQVKEEQS